MSAPMLALGAVVALVGFCIRQEYPDVARRCARRLVAFATRLERPDRRERSAEEWAAELEAVQSDVTTATGLAWSVSLASSYATRRGAALIDPLYAACIMVSTAAATGSGTLTLFLTANCTLFSAAMDGFGAARRGAPSRRKRTQLTASARTFWWVFFAGTSAVAVANGGWLGAFAVVAFFASWRVNDRLIDWRTRVWGFDPIT